MRLIKLSSGHIVDLERMLFLQPPVKVHMPNVEPQMAQLVFGVVAIQLNDLDYQVVKNALVNILENQDQM